MNLKSTIVLLIIALVVGVAIWQGANLAPKAGLAPPPEEPAKGKSAQSLAVIVPGEITALTVNVPGSVPVKFTAAEAGKPLELPGNWPARRNEVEELVAAVTGLKSRFQAVPIGDDLKPYGLTKSQDPVVVEVVAKNGTHTLTFGEAPIESSENPFVRPAFVRVDSEPEVLRLGPDVLPILRRNAEFYRKRQLFPDATRIRVAESSRGAQEAQPQFLLSDAVTAITVEGPMGRYVLKRTGESPKPSPPPDKPTGDAVVLAPRLAEVWEIAEPIHDRVDPAKLKAILAAVPDLWVEQFLLNPDVLAALANVLPVGVAETPAGAAARAATGSTFLTLSDKEGEFLSRAGLKNPESKITLSLKDGTTRTLLIGKTTRTNVRTESAPPPPIPGAPPQPPKIVEEKFYFAKLADNPLVFEIKGDKLGDLLLESKSPSPMDPFAKFDPPTGKAVDQLRDPNPARFDAEQVVDVTIQRPGQTLQLKKTKGDPKAESESAKKDRWDLVSPFTGLAEGRQVSDLLEPLERLAAKKGEVIDLPVLRALVGSLGVADVLATGLTPDRATTVTIVSDPKSNVAPRTLTIGTSHDSVGKKMFVMADNASRLNVLDDAAFAIVERQPRAYRALKLFDLGDDRVESIVVKGEKEQFRLQETIGAKETTFTLTEPVKADADKDKASNLLKDLGSLEATEYVYDPPTDAEANAIRLLSSFLGVDLLKASAGSHGFDKPAATATIYFAGPKAMMPRMLTIGKAREGKPEYFAKLNGSPSVFAIKKEVAESLTGGSLALMPLQLWNGDASGLSVVEVQRGTESPYTLKQEAGAWKITAPFQADADMAMANPIAGALSNVRAEKYAAHAPFNPSDFGLDKPAVKVKFTLTERKVNKPGDEPKEETKERTLLIGKPEAEGKTNRFARLEGDPNTAVFVINDALFKDVDKPALELLNKKLLSVPPTTVTKIELAGPDGPLTLQKEGNDWKPVGATFPVDKPTVDTLLRIFANLNAIRFAAYGDTIDWAKYGLDANSKPQTITVVAGPLPHKLELGKVVEGTPNDRYVRVDNGKAVAELAVTTARDLSKSKLDLVERTIFKFDPIDLTAIRRNMGGQDFEATLEGTNWNVTKPMKLNADQQGLEELADQLSRLRAERVADIEGKDLAKFGLDKPAATIKLELIGKGGKPTEKSLKIGAAVEPMKPDGDRFAQTEGATTVVVMAGGVAKRLMAEPIKFRDRSLANFVTADKVVITRNGKDATFLKSGAWKMKEPVEADAEDEALRETHDALARLRAEEIVTEKAADLKQYGLDKPERWRLFNGDKEVLNLLVGNREKVGEPGKEKEGFRAYAKLDKGDLVVLLDMSLTAKLNAEYRKRALWEPLDVAQAMEIRVDTPEGPGSFHLTKGPLGWIDPLNPSERISNETVTDFLDAFAGLKAEKFIEHATTDGGKIYGLEPPKKTITVTVQGGQKRTILLGRLDDQKRVYAKLEGKKEIVVLSEKDTGRVNKDRGGFLTIADKKELEKKEPPKAEPKKGPDAKKEEPKKD